ncbi:SMI1/KNR4 family protein [Streptomyces sp. NBC_00063]|uniref:SMI1/KNR4 family protein n=1 Tax=Streptomyces sp. NBC_00063 TaxID=2975638 RepID=UPI002251C0C5|nr:SMI1/KNR4 family protein [Streptomyces sp. NBC_00063]MCX5441310.1 SMI1/KNR4 family protein [Streptomyces sp. NBC_00063]
MTPDLTQLTELLPRPHSSGQVPDWNAAESTLQTALPADYKELIEAYGGGGFIDGYLLLLEPGCRNDVYDLIKISAEREEANDSLWQFEDKPAELEAEGSRLICWATTDNGEYLYWLMQPGDDPDTRPILINDESGEDWERYDMTVTRFLVGELSGEIRSQILWNQFPQPDHEFRTAHEMAD